MVIAVNSFSQTEEITESQYWLQFRMANEQPFKSSKRITTKEVSQSEKYPYTKEIIEEFLNPDRRRYIEIKKENNRTAKAELILIGKTYYCRINEGLWKQSEQWCAPMTLTQMPEPKTSKLTVEETKVNGQPVKFYQKYNTYINEYFSTKDKEGITYFHDKFWVDNKGFMIRREWEFGLIEPKKVFETRVTIYEYNVKDIKIEAPKIVSENP